jgi:hypothetical protein
MSEVVTILNIRTKVILQRYSACDLDYYKVMMFFGI